MGERQRSFPNNTRYGSNAPPRLKYSPSNDSAQIPSSTTLHANNMVSFPYAHVDSSSVPSPAKLRASAASPSLGSTVPFNHVTSLADDGPGSLHQGCRSKEPLWIVFEVSGTIHLSSYLAVSSYKTIDGRGLRVKFTGKGLRLKECEHVIICNLEFEGGKVPDADGIQLKPNSKHIWIPP